MQGIVKLTTVGVAAVIGFIAAALVMGDAQTMTGLASPFVDLQSVNRWAVSATLLAIAAAVSVIGYVLAKKESERGFEA